MIEKATKPKTKAGRSKSKFGEIALFINMHPNPEPNLCFHPARQFHFTTTPLQRCTYLTIARPAAVPHISINMLKFSKFDLWPPPKYTTTTTQCIAVFPSAVFLCWAWDHDNDLLAYGIQSYHDIGYEEIFERILRKAITWEELSLQLIVLQFCNCYSISDIINK